MSDYRKHRSRRFIALTAILLASTPIALLGNLQSSRVDLAAAPKADPQPTGTNSKSVDWERVGDTSSPIFGIKIPEGYRQWELISVASNPQKDELKSIFGDKLAMKAYRDGTLPFPDGSTLVKLTWKREPLDGFEGAFVPGSTTMVQVMVKDAKKFATTGGWGFGRFIDGKPADEAQHKSCFGCHSKNSSVREHDFVFTHLAP
ncbi:cytochrome P460 family protein [Telmatocola sphagniphila]|uniref:Cytochrome P460 family protein n=1 Tax=Telmatocola sphagniphila TaxID=1123043 RepID=A0A8E6B759_9BACT|nr:cytochrome P460 family protein [Telmatocola sphagniphila]QVL31788.1 cytochrome P460 family protein [Telmatocola sphagniphila]